MKVFTLILALASLSLFTGSLTAASANIATINLQTVFDDYYKTKLANDLLKERAAEMEKEFGKLREQGQAAQDQYRKALDASQNQAVSAGEREKSKQEAEAKLLQMRALERSMGEFEKQASATLKEQERRVRDNILEEIKNAVTALAKSRGYTLVMNTKAESVFSAPVVLYSVEDNDITDVILTQMNANAPAAAQR